MVTLIAASGAVSILVMLVAIRWLWRSPYEKVIETDRCKDRR